MYIYVYNYLKIIHTYVHVYVQAMVETMNVQSIKQVKVKEKLSKAGKGIYGALCCILKKKKQK